MEQCEEVDGTPIQLPWKKSYYLLLAVGGLGPINVFMVVIWIFSMFLHEWWEYGILLLFSVGFGSIPLMIIGKAWRGRADRIMRLVNPYLGSPFTADEIHRTIIRWSLASAGLQGFILCGLDEVRFFWGDLGSIIGLMISITLLAVGGFMDIRKRSYSYPMP